VTSFRAHRRVGVERAQRASNAFRFRQHAPVIDERANRQQLRKLDDSTVVVGVEVRCQQIGDLRHAGIPGGGENPVRGAGRRRVAR